MRQGRRARTAVDDPHATGQKCPASEPSRLGGIIPEWWATLSRNPGRHHPGIPGRPSRDPHSFGQIEVQCVEAWLVGLREELVSKTSRPDPVRRVMIPKPNGG